jgi:bifunctional non-homologous end joining protein LigD
MTEIKHDGYRLILQRDGRRVRLFTRNGHDWSGRFPLISEAALRNRNTSFVIDGEAVLLGVDGRSDFNGLHYRKHDDEVQLYAFDCLMSDGEDLRKLPLTMRKTNLARLLARPVDGIFLSDFEQGEIGPDLFRHACLMGLEGLVSKHRESLYRGGSIPQCIALGSPSHDRFDLRRYKQVGDKDHLKVFANEDAWKSGLPKMIRKAWRSLMRFWTNFGR